MSEQNSENRNQATQYSVAVEILEALKRKERHVNTRRYIGIALIVWGIATCYCESRFYGFNAVAKSELELMWDSVTFLAMCIGIALL